MVKMRKMYPSRGQISKKISDREPKRGQNILKAPIRAMCTPIRGMEKKNLSINFGN